MELAQAHVPDTFVTFRVADLFFGVPVLQVQEVLREQSVTPVPLAADYIKGLVNLRGQIITAIDLRSLLRLGGERECAPMNVVFNNDGETLSLVVDSIGDVIKVDPHCYEAVPTTIPAHLRALLGGVFKLERELLLVLERLTSAED